MPHSNKKSKELDLPRAEAQVSWLDSLPLLRCLVMRSFPAFTLKAISTSNFVSYVRVLKFLRTEEEANFVARLAELLPSFQALEELQVIGRCSDPQQPSAPIRSYGTWKHLFTASWPPSVRRLTLDRLAGQRLKNLATLLNQGGLPNLEELYLPFMNIQGNIDALDQLGIAFRGYGGSKISTLYLHVDNTDKARCWDAIIRVLSLNIEEPDARIFPNLKVGDRDLPSLTRLILGNMDWFCLGRALLDGRFPRLKRLWASSAYYNDDLLADMWYPNLTLPQFYEIDSRTSKLWFNGVLRQRSSLKPFQKDLDIHFLGSEQVGALDGSRQNLGKEILSGLSKHPSHIAPCVQTLHLSGVRLDEQACKALIGTIKIHGLSSVRSLQFLFDEKCHKDLFGSLGEVLNNDLLPALIALDIGTHRERSDELSLCGCWQAFFGSMARGDLSKLETLAAGYSVQEVCVGLAPLGCPLVIFGSIIRFTAYGDLDAKDIAGISAVVRSGAFPSLRILRLRPGTCTV